MTSFASFVSPRFATPLVHTRQVEAQASNAGYAHLETVAFNHALVALAAKLAVVDGAPNKAEYAAFHALFDTSEADTAKNRNLFVQRVTDSGSALQYARQIAGMSKGNSTLHLELMHRLLRIATADAALNAGEIELLRAVADILGLSRETFRELVAKTMVKPSATPYEILGISSRASDAELREHYMNRVQMLHPDRYQAAGASAETVAMLSDQLAAVNAAYKTITAQRGKKTSRTSEQQTSWWGRWNTKGARVN